MTAIDEAPEHTRIGPAERLGAPESKGSTVSEPGHDERSCGPRSGHDVGRVVGTGPRIPAGRRTGSRGSAKVATEMTSIQLSAESATRSCVTRRR